ncbi:hypothetical protein QP166_13265 [Sphingomonas sp. LR60]|uniref:hypothetical protein n=1 Tax=Sphingomonas sp. LR60 TaxID=3050233 RepID=UPI002FE28487
MSEIDRWLSANNRYLDGELKALRARLAARADQPLPVPVAATVRPFSATLQRWFRPHATTPAAEPVAPRSTASPAPSPARTRRRQARNMCPRWWC